MEEEDDDDDDEKRRGKLIQSCQEDNMYTFVIVPHDFSGSTNTVCFFVLCKRHQLNRVPGAHLGSVCVYLLPLLSRWLCRSTSSLIACSSEHRAHILTHKAPSPPTYMRPMSDATRHRTSLALQTYKVIHTPWLTLHHHVP